MAKLQDKKLKLYKRTYVARNEKHIDYTAALDKKNAARDFQGYGIYNDFDEKKKTHFTPEVAIEEIELADNEFVIIRTSSVSGEMNCTQILLAGEIVLSYNDNATFDYPEDLTWGRNIGELFRDAFELGKKGAIEKVLEQN